MKKVFLGRDRVCFEYETLGQLREECKKYGVSIGNGVSIGYGVSIGNDVSIGNGVSIGYGVSIGNDVSILKRAKIPAKIKINKIIHLANEYKYSVSGYIFENVKYIQMGCFTRTSEQWDADFWNNNNEFLEGSEAGTKRLNAYKKMKMILDFEKDENE